MEDSDEKRGHQIPCQSADYHQDNAQETIPALDFPDRFGGMRFLNDVNKAGITLSLLRGQWMELLEYLAREPDPEVPVRIIAWDFQQPVLRVLRERGVLPAKARIGMCLLQAK